ncbi:MAG: hypothetical protein GXP22_04375 [Gammaproteobacteria bacterium]|nr:hypothetical protein [Gammaproteobacteria bacterium]
MKQWMRVCGCTATLLVGFSVSPVRANILISELFYDAVGSDSGRVFVELYGSPGMSLDDLYLEAINGSNGSSYLNVELSGVIPADGVFVIADNMSGGGTQVANADLIASIDLQNGPDSLLLRDSSQIWDAIGYGDFSSAQFFGENLPAPDTMAGQSLVRDIYLTDSQDNSLDFSLSSIPTPGEVPLLATPIPPALGLFLAGLGLLAGNRRYN